MKECNKIENVQLLGLDNIETIGDYFMEGCENLKNIHLKGLNNLETIGEGFAFGCTNLETIDLSSAIKLDFKNIVKITRYYPNVKILQPVLE